MIGRLVHRIASTISSRLGYKNIHIHIMPEIAARLYQSTSLMVSCLLLLPWCTAITGYWISSNNGNSQQQPTHQLQTTSKSLLGTSWPTRVITTTNRICKHDNSTVAKETSCHMSHETFHYLSEFYEYYLVHYMPNNFIIKYAISYS